MQVNLHGFNFFLNMNIEERIKLAETRIFKAVFPNTTNHYDTLFWWYCYAIDG